MKTIRICVVVFAIAFLFAGCAIRSISDSGYRERGYYYRGDNGQYIGELNELSVLGVNSDEEISESDIQKSLSKPGGISLRRGDSIVMIQSGARFPDSPMTEKMTAYFEVIPLSGIPDQSNRCCHEKEKTYKKPPLNRTLRLAAARTGAKAIIVYWCILETARDDIVTKTISWVPIAGSILPDENQQMRIHIKGAVIDVASGNWMMINAESFGDERISARLNRAASDQKQVAVLKEKAYGNFVEKLTNRFPM